MDITALLLFLLIGVVAGWLAGKIIAGGGFGIIGNLAVGVTGAFVGGFIVQFFGIEAGGLIGSIVTATVGAIVLLFVVGLIKRGA